MASPYSRCIPAGRYTIPGEHFPSPKQVYSDRMANVMLAPIESTATTTCLKVDSVEWAIFVQLMKDEGRSASDRVREMVRETVREHQSKGQRRARS